MRPYELMFVLKPDLDNDAVEAFTEKISSIIQADNGAVDEVTKWGRRKLAYEINDIKDGIYSVVNFHSGPEVPKELDRVLKLADEVLRFLIFRTDT